MREMDIQYPTTVRHQVERTTPVCNGSHMTAGGFPVNACIRGRLGLRLGLLYSRKATALAGAEREALGQKP